MRRLLPLALLPLSACALVGGAERPAARYAVPDVVSDERIPVAVSTISVREVALPDYARHPAIWHEDAAGAMVHDPQVLWADLPARGVTQELTRHLASLTGARVAAEPWPYAAAPDAVLEVRVHEMIAGSDGRFRLAGQYFTAGQRDAAGDFDLWAPIEGAMAPAGIAAARADAVKELARQIAASGF